jgi:transposase InsO family protein
LGAPGQGTEFFNYEFQEALAVNFIKFRPIKPRSPHLNGKVERSQQTDKEEFYALLDKKDSQLDWQQALAQWENFYNQQRHHSSLHGKTPWEKYLEVKAIILSPAQVQQQYLQKKEIIRARNSYFLQWQKKNNLA